MKHFNISIHDITKSTLKNVKKLKEILQEESVEKISYLMIPRYHEKENLTEVADEIKSLVKNGEPILHGYTHKGKKLKKLSPIKLLTDNEGEFISYNNVEERLIKGKEILEKINVKPEGFIAPAWLMKKSDFKYLKKLNFKFTTSRFFIYNLQTEEKTFSPVITFSSREPMQWISMETFLPQIDLYARFLKVVRIALHPSDAENEEKIRYIRKGIRDLKRLGKESFINEILNGEKS